MFKRTVTVAAMSAAVLSAFLLCARSARASGFAIYEVGAAPTGMANAVTGQADRPDAIFFNPAGLTTQSGLSFEASASLIAPAFSYDTTVPGGGAISISGDTQVFVVPSVYATYRIHDRVAAGIGVYTPFGLGIKWPNQFETDSGQKVAWWGRGLIQKIDLQSVYINPTVAFKIHDRIHVGAGFVIAQAAVSLRRAVTMSASPADDITVDLSGQDVGFGATAGVLVKVIPKLLNLGVTYRSGVAFTFSGQAAFSKTDASGNAIPVPAGLRSRLVDGDVRAPITMPHTISFGLSAFPLDNLIVGFNLDVVTWSTYDQLRIDFVDNPDLNTSEPKNWRNTVTVRFGAQYKILGDNLPVRLGFIYDQSPAPDTTVGPELPDTDRYVVALGGGYTLPFGLSVDLAYQYLLTGSDATADTAPIVGSRSASAHIASLGLAYNLSL